MPQSDRSSDIAAIRALVDRQFGSLEWSPDQPAQWAAFKADFLPDARLFPSARPVKSQSVDSFVERMKGLSKSSLASFRERMLGIDVRLFGNVAVALAACENTENEEGTNRGVEALLLVKDDGAWRIAAQAWDMERDGLPIPKDLLD